MTVPDDLIRPGERLDDLCRGGMRILQRPDGFLFGMDSVLLAAFAAQWAGHGRVADLGAGSGVLALLIAARADGASVDAVEIQPGVADMAARSVRLNGLDHRIHVHAMDYRDAPERLGHGRFGLVVSNPPYGRSGGTLKNPDASRRTARHEGEAGVAVLCEASFRLLQNGGRLCVVFPAPRLLELFDAMRAARIEPKRVRLVHPREGAAPNLALVQGAKAARPALHFLPPLFVRDCQGRETEELRRLYEA